MSLAWLPSLEAVRVMELTPVDSWADESVVVDDWGAVRVMSLE